MKIKIGIENRFTGEVIFELEKENNTIKQTLAAATKSGNDLRGCDLAPIKNDFLLFFYILLLKFNF